MGKIKTANVIFADLRYYKDGCGVELSESLARGLLVEANGAYVNPLDFTDCFPVFERAFSANVTLSGDEFGTRMHHVGNQLASGPCWVLTSKRLSDVIADDTISLDKVENYVLNSSEFYLDRNSVALKRLEEGKKTFDMVRIIRTDQAKLDKVYDFFSEREFHLQKIKKD